MLNIFGALGRVASLLPNYLEGQRAAVQDNWRDLEKYNAVQAGQLQNLFDERVMPWRINRYGDLANISRWQSYADTLKGMETLMGAGGRAWNAIQSNYRDPAQAQQAWETYMANMQRAMSPDGGMGWSDIMQMGQNPWAMMQQQQTQQQQQSQATAPNATARVQTQQATAAQSIPQ